MKRTRMLAIVVLVLIGMGVVYAVDLFFVPDSTSIQVVGTDVVFSTSFKTVIGRTYQVQYQSSDSANSDTWITASNFVSATGGTVTWSYTDVGAAVTSTQRFYRLRVAISGF